MADREEEEELRTALEMSMQQSMPETKRSKPLDSSGVVIGSPGESPEVKNRRIRRELMAAAAEKRMTESKKFHAVPEPSLCGTSEKCNSATKRLNCDIAVLENPSIFNEKIPVEFGNMISKAEANKLFSFVFGSEVTKNILIQWTHQGIRFSPDAETSMGLVQHQSGPCGVLAAIQAYVLKHILFSPDELGKVAENMQPGSSLECASKGQLATSNHFAFITEDIKSRALIKSICEILFLCGDKRRSVIATLNLPGPLEGSACSSTDEISIAALDGVAIDSASDLEKILKVEEFTTHESAYNRMKSVLPEYQSRMGALLFLVSALLSRGLDSIEEDRDDPTQPLVTAPFGHASQEIVNLLLCGQAVPNVFDGQMDLGGGMFLKGVSTSVEVGFLTLLESLNLCKVGQFLKCPQWPIWVVGSESHYTVLFALDPSVQDENELEERESRIRRAFDAHDRSGGGGFVSAEGLHCVLGEAEIELPADKLDQLCGTGFIVWSEFWQTVLELDTSSGGLKDTSGLMGRKVFDLYHFNGIAKSMPNGGSSTSLVQRPRLTKLSVTVPPRWTPEEFLSVPPSESMEVDTAKSEPSKHAPLVDCIRTRWPRASCTWEGDPPSIV